MASVSVVEKDSESREYSSDEDTEDASESDLIGMDVNDTGKQRSDRYHRSVVALMDINSSLEEKLPSLQSQLKQLEEGKDAEYLKRVEELQEMMEKRIFVAKVFKDYELEMASEEYKREKMVAMQQFEMKGLELKECLLSDLHDKKKAYDQYRHSIDLSTGVDSFEPKSMVTRKLRRRNYEPIPMVEKRRKVTPLSSLVYILEENEVDEDIKAIFKGKVVSAPKNPPPVPVSSSESGVVYEAHVEDGKLFYENKWFHKGQHIFIESKEHGQESGVITSISQNEIWVKRLPDSSKLRIYLSHLTRGKYVLKRRSA